MDDLDGLLDSLGTPDVEAKAPADAHAAPAGDESFSSSASGDAPAPKKTAEAVVQAKEDAHPDDTAELAVLDQLLDSILTEGEDSEAAAPAAPQKNETAADSPGRERILICNAPCRKCRCRSGNGRQCFFPAGRRTRDGRNRSPSGQTGRAFTG